MYEYEQKARPQSQLARVIAITLFLIAGATFLTTFGMKSYAWVGQFAALVLLTAAALLTVEFVVKTYFYRTEKRGDGDYDFVIVDVQAKRRSVLVRLSFRKQIDTFLEDAESISRVKKDKGVRTYSHCPDLMPAGACAILAHDGDETICVIFEPDETMKKTIRALVAGSRMEV